MPEQEGQEQVDPGSGEGGKEEKGQAEGQQEGQKEVQQAEVQQPGEQPGQQFDYKGRGIEPTRDEAAFLMRAGMEVLEGRAAATKQKEQKEQEEPAKPAEQEAEAEAGTLTALEQRLAKAEQTAKDANARSEKLEGLREQDLIGTQVQRALDQQAAKYDFTRDDEVAQREIEERVLLAIRRDQNKSVGTAYKEAVDRMTSFVETKAGKKQSDWVEKKIKDGQTRGQLGGGAARGGEVREIKASDLNDGTADKEALELVQKADMD
jgi:hypothetical protein